MQVSLRARLTAWYSLLVVLTIAVFATAVLWLHWRLLLKQFDQGLQSTAATADNVFAEELEELKDRSRAAAEMTELVGTDGGAVQVLDSSGAPVGPDTRVMPLPRDIGSAGAVPLTETLTGPGGQQWRVLVRRRTIGGQDYYFAAGIAPRAGARAVADAPEGIAHRPPAGLALRGRWRLVARMVWVAADATDRDRGAGDHRKDSREPADHPPLDHRARSARRIVQPCARSARAAR